MKSIQKVLLGIVTFFCPVFLAACYGPPMDYYPEVKDLKPQQEEDLNNIPVCVGKVIDSVGQGGIKGIEVYCSIGQSATAKGVTGPDGVYSFEYDPLAPCESLIFRDADGTQNGGEFVEKTVSADQACDNTVTMDLQEQ